MPIYEAMCECGHQEDYYATVDQRLMTPWCCGKRMHKVILTPTMVTADLPSYTSPIDGKWIDGRKQRKEDLKRAGCRPWEGLDQERKESAKQTKYSDQKLDASLTKAASEAFYQLSPSKRDLLKDMK